MLVNLARRNQSMLYRQLEIINQLEESERNPDALAELFRLDHLTTRVRRNAENLLVLSGEKPPRVWSQPVPLRDVVRAAIAETEDLDRVAFEIPEGPLVDGASVTDVTHLLAELTENAVRFSPPDTAVTIRGRRDPRGGRGQLITVEDWGVGMDEADLAAANTLLAEPPEVDLSVSKRLGFHVVSRLAARHGIRVVLSPTPGSGVTASVALPGSLFELGPEPVGALVPAAGASAARRGRPAPRRRADQPAAAQPAPAAPERVAADRTAFERTAFDRAAAFAWAGLGRTADGVRVDRLDMDRVASDDAGPGLADDSGADVRALIPGPRMPLPAETGVLGSEEPAERVAPSRTGWRAGPDPARTGSAGADTGSDEATATIATSTVPARPTNGDAPQADATSAARPTLRRRVPQAHLAPGLRIVTSTAEPADPAPLPVAAAALSRYQASRAAARSAVDGPVANEAADERSSR
jgi:hypothetical protein